MNPFELAQELNENYYTATQAAQALKLSKSRVLEFCMSGRFVGAFKFGSVWIIPKNSVDYFKPHPSGRPSTKNAELIKRLKQENLMLCGSETLSEYLEKKKNNPQP